MPKKFAGENSKAAVARARKSAAKEEEEFKKQKAIEDEFWKDDNKNLVKKQQRKEQQLQKKQALLDKKAESKALLEEESNSIKTPGKQSIAKITQAQIQAENEKRRAAAQAKPNKEQSEAYHEKPLEENLNRLTNHLEEAHNVEDAIAILSIKDGDKEKHPEKRMKAAFKAFEHANFARIKEENPTLRLIQLKQILKKKWMKSPDNPFNQLRSTSN